MSVDYVAMVGDQPYEVHMTSKERHEARYQRRKAKRQARKEELNKLYGDFDKATSYKTLHNIYYKCRLATSWKGSVQKYGIDIMKNTLKIHDMMRAGEDTFKGFYSFDVCERGKIRHIRSVHISERCVQKAICQTSLVPMLQNSFIYDNGASRKGKGTSFALDRVTEYLYKYFRYYGDNEGYIVKLDFKGYFDNINHDEIVKIIDKTFSDKRYVYYIDQTIRHYGDKGLGLGSEENQILAMALPNDFDHWIKTVKRIKPYVRYCDDSIIIARTKDEARQLLSESREYLKKYKIDLNEKKTQIIKLSHGFTFLQIKFSLTNTGKVIRRPCRNKIVRERRKLRRLYNAYKRGEIDRSVIDNQYKTWRGQFRIKQKNIRNHTYKIKHRHLNVYRTVRNMDGFYNSLFKEE